ncbi:phage terminase large subunit [Paenibacillus sp. FSL L8-0499]|uniref:phage terminase large subunit n=1 Tax=Paenibacillus sp. FSL L8-0499 TaxID=2975334 RepID=UPI0030F95BD9
MRTSLARLPTLDEVRQARAYADFSYFMDYDSEYRDRPGKHLDVLDETLMKVSTGEIKRLIVTMPPRHGKSERVSKKFPAWHVGRNPSDEIIVASYSIDLSRGFSRISRDTLTSNNGVFDASVDPNNKSSESWGIEGYRGGVTAAGVGGSITGKGARIAIIDDPVKNAEEANSEVMREKVWDWYTSTLYTRLTPDGRIVVVMTRWHEDDLVGRLLKKEADEIKDGTHKGERWTVINFPAIAEDNDYLGRKPGEALWPEFGFDTQRLEQIKSDVGSYVFNALYQQRPTAAEGAMIKRDWWRYYDSDPERMKFDEIIQSWDCTFKDSDGSDFVVGQVWGRKDADKYLLDMVRARMDINQTMDAIRNMSAKWPKARLKLIEEKANGAAIIQMLNKKIGGLVPIVPKDSKISRVSTIVPDIEAHNVYIPSDKPWVQDFVEECAAFPKGTHDDMVDAMSQALNRWVLKTVHKQDNKPQGSFYGTELEDMGYKKNEMRKVR